MGSNKEVVKDLEEKSKKTSTLAKKLYDSKIKQLKQSNTVYK